MHNNVMVRVHYITDILLEFLSAADIFVLYSDSKSLLFYNILLSVNNFRVNPYLKVSHTSCELISFRIDVTIKILKSWMFL